MVAHNLCKLIESENYCVHNINFRRGQIMQHDKLLTFLAMPYNVFVFITRSLFPFLSLTLYPSTLRCTVALLFSRTITKFGSERVISWKSWLLHGTVAVFHSMHFDFRCRTRNGNPTSVIWIKFLWEDKNIWKQPHGGLAAKAGHIFNRSQNRAKFSSDAWP